MADSLLQQLYKSDRNPIQEQEYQKLLAQQGVTGADVGSGGNGADANGLTSAIGGVQNTNQTLATAAKVRDFTIQSNQPAIQSLNQASTDLKSRYADILDSIKGAQKVASDQQTLATGNELAKRGISNDSGLYQQQQASAQAPLAAAYGSQIADSGLQEQNTLNNLAQQIGAYQTGNPASALDVSQGIRNASQSASQFQQNLQAQQQQQASQLALAREQNAAKPPDRYVNIGSGGLYDTMTGQVIQGQAALKAATGNVGGGGF